MTSHGFASAVRRADLVASEVSDAAIRRARRAGDFVPLHRGVDLTRRGLRTTSARERAALLVVPHGVLSGPSAARLHRLDVPLAWTDEITVAPGASRPRQRPGLRVVSRSVRHGVTSIGGMPTTNAARTAAELACRTDLRAAERLWVLDQTLRHVDRTALAVAIDRLRRGSREARHLLGVADPKGESPLESAVALALAGAPVVPPPVRQHEARLPDGRFLARLDFAWPDARVALEADGIRFHGVPAALFRDRERQNALAAAGWVVLRVTWADLTDPAHLIFMITSTLQQRIAS